MDQEQQIALAQLRIAAESKVKPPLKFPDGYCTDPNGVIVPAAGMHEHYNFGYEVGFREAWEILCKTRADVTNNSEQKAVNGSLENCQCGSPTGCSNCDPHGTRYQK